MLIPINKSFDRLSEDLFKNTKVFFDRKNERERQQFYDEVECPSFDRMQFKDEKTRQQFYKEEKTKRNSKSAKEREKFFYETEEIIVKLKNGTKEVAYYWEGKATQINQILDIEAKRIVISCLVKKISRGSSKKYYVIINQRK